MQPAQRLLNMWRALSICYSSMPTMGAPAHLPGYTFYLTDKWNHRIIIEEEKLISVFSDRFR